MKKVIKINYFQSLKEYKLQLVSKLRDFGPNNLQLWVPNDDIILSLLSMVFSLSQNKFNNVDILLENEPMQPNYLLSLKKIFFKFSRFKIVNNKQIYNLQILDIRPNVLEKTFNNYSKYIQKNQKINNNLNLNKKTFERKKFDLRKIEKFYHINLNKKKNYHFLPLNLFNKLKNKRNYYISENENIKIALKIKNGFIIEGKYNYKNDSFHNNYLDKFIELINNLPLFEAYEHGVIKLEYLLRPKKITKKIDGIIAPLAINKVFFNLQKLMRNLWIDYLKTNNLKQSRNFYDIDSNKKWINLKKKLKIKAIKQVLTNFQSKNRSNCLYFNNLNKDSIKLTLDIEKNNNANFNISAILLKFEKYIRLMLDRRIEVFYNELKDSNKLRKKNSPI